MAKILKGLSVEEFLHPEDREGLRRLDAVPGVKSFLAETISNIRERFVTVEMMGDGINITQESYPELYSSLAETSKILSIDNVPGFSTKWAYEISMGTEGVKHPRISTLSGAVDILSKEEFSFLLGHELGHLMAGHVPYHNLLITFYTPLLNSIPNAEMFLALLRPMLLQWFRLSDFTADRAGLLACQDINVAITTLAKMSGVPRKYHNSIDVEAFLRQAERFEQNNGNLMDNIIQNLSINTACVPWLVVRAAKLYGWYKNGEYDELIKKHTI